MNQFFKGSLLVFLLSIIGMQVLAQSVGRISGRIIDAQANELSYAHVYVKDTKFSTVTDLSGKFSIGGVPAGEYEIIAHYLGYDDATQSIQVKENQTVSIEMVMEENATQLEGIVVYGDASRGQAKALNEQMNSISIKNVVSSEQFGTMPDRNGSEALQRIPGISINRNRGEGADIQIRGVSSEYNQMQMNGTPMPGGADNRGTSLDFLAVDLMDNIEVKKTLTPDMDGGAIGGAVNFTMKDAPEQLTIKAMTSGGRNFHVDEYNAGGGLGLQQHNMFIGNRFFDNKLGVLINGSYYQTNRGTELNQYLIDDADSLIQKRYNDYDVKRVRYGYSTALDYRFNENHVIRGSYNKNYFEDHRIRRRADFNYRRWDEQENSVDGGAITAYDEVREVQNRLKSTSMDVYQIGGEHKFNNGIEFDYKYSHISTEVEEPDGTQYYFGRILSPEDIQGQDIWGVTAKTMIRPEDPLYMKGGRGQKQGVRKDEMLNVEKDNSFVANLKIPIDFMGKRTNLQTGYKFWKKTKDRQATRFTADPTEEVKIYAPDFFNEGVTYRDAAFNDLPLGDWKANNSVLNNNYYASEQINAAYIMADLPWTSKFNTLIGARMEHTANHYIFDEYNSGEFVQTLNDRSNYVNILPSINAVYKFDKQNSLKAAVTQGIARPAFTSLIPREVIDDEARKMSISNPDLKPVVATNFDIIYERYTSNMGYFTAGAFAKLIDGQIVSTTEYHMIDGQPWEITKPLNADQAKLFGFEVAYSHRFINSGVPVLEWMSVMANYTFTWSQQKIIRNGNTIDDDGNLIEGEEIVRVTQMGNSPRDIFNLNLTYDNPNSGLMIAISGNYRAPLLIEMADRAERDIYFSQQFHLDLSASYAINENLSIFTQMNNLTNQKEREVYGNPYSAGHILHQTEQYGPTVTIGAKFNL
ncbi:TonB-dependent receptor [Aureibacter tunicatorum]|uniref:TonB-dependent receptor n=1 Tax=Aureibacter tunicatorum TaxID=866807 RepID=A0AAE4BUV9_9BACT|nr:TonB-dependent receptor [Aureibacter tunicatorum]MDR6241465.1 TonB-dependent receptor [Aureibacter tunicatorum]BDD06692.1 TonB-dependent receptor [Aureibacter tunicatorum]